MALNEPQAMVCFCRYVIDKNTIVVEIILKVRSECSICISSKHQWHPKTVAPARGEFLNNFFGISVFQSDCSVQMGALANDAQNRKCLASDVLDIDDVHLNFIGKLLVDVVFHSSRWWFRQWSVSVTNITLQMINCTQNVLVFDAVHRQHLLQFSCRRM